MLTSTAPTTSWRKKEIAQQYLAVLSKYIQDLKEGKTDEVLEIRDFAGMLHIHPVHLSHTIKEVTGQSSCIVDQKIECIRIPV